MRRVARNGQQSQVKGHLLDALSARAMQPEVLACWASRSPGQKEHSITHVCNTSLTSHILILASWCEEEAGERTTSYHTHTKSGLCHTTRPE